MKAAENPFRGIKKLYIYSLAWIDEPIPSQITESRYDPNHKVALDCFGELEHVVLVIAARPRDVFELPANGAAGDHISKEYLDTLQEIAAMIRDYATRRNETNNSLIIPRITHGRTNLV